MDSRLRHPDAFRTRPIPSTRVRGRVPGPARGAWLAAGLVGVLLALLPAWRAQAQEIESRYQLAVTQFYQVQRDAAGTPEERAARWQAVAQTFQRIHRDGPAQARGADALYSAAIALREAWLVGKEPAQATAALDAFREFSKAYPNHKLADDSLMHQALLLESQSGGTMAAVELYRQVARRQPPGAQAARARARLYALQREEPSAAAASAPERSSAADRNMGDGSSSQSSSQAVAFAPGAEASPLGAAAVPRGAVSSQTAGPSQAAAPARNGPARLKRMQVLAALQFTRIILTTDRPVKPKVERIAGAPARLRLDFRRLEPEPELAVPRSPADGLVRRIEVTALGKRATRLEIEAATLERYELKTFELPLETKLVVDLYPQRPAAAREGGKSAAGTRARAAGRTASARSSPAAAAPAPASSAPALADSRRTADPADAAAAERLSLKASLGLKVRTLMIDPGHGGHDPGAMAFGLKEKDLALAIALRLRDLVAQRHPDVRVGMTRDDDRFVPLSRRPQLAKALGADLFVSIHLNASQVERFHGVETYFLNLTSDASALEVAARENATSERKVSDLNVILLDLLRDTNILESSKLAQATHTELVDTLREADPVRDLGVKQAPFMVLIGAEMPGVLVEAGFITNRSESERLRSADYLNRIAEGIYAGLDKYMSGEEIVQARPRSRLLTRIAP